MNASFLPQKPLESVNDLDLLNAITDRDEHALAAVYDRYAPLCYTIAFRIAHDPLVAEGILQDAFLKVWKKADCYDGRGTVAGWIVRITRNQALDWLRHERTHDSRKAYSWDGDAASVERDGARMDYGENPEGRMTIQETRQQVRLALAQLPVEQRNAVELSFLEGLSHHAIAERTGLPLGTVKTRVRLGLQKMRVLLSPVKDMLVW